MDKEANNIKSKNNNEQSQLNSSFVLEKSNRTSKLGKNGSTVKSYDKKNLSTINKNRIKQTITEDKEKEDFIPLYNKKNFNININNKINNIKQDNSEYTTPYISSLTQTNFMDIRSPKFGSRNISLDNIINKQILENSAFRSMKNIPLSPSTNVLSTDNNTLVLNTEKSSPKFSNKMNKVRDDYIDFLQKHIEDYSKNNTKLDTNNKEFLKKFNDLIQDNRLLNKTLNERTNNLSKIVEENLYIKGELEKSILINQKNLQKMAFYEEQLKLFKSNNDNYQKIIMELKQHNEQLNLNLVKIKNTSEENKKKSEEKYKNEIEEIKKSMEDKIQTGDKNYEAKIKALTDEIKILKEKNTELEKELQSKENVIQLMYKDNEKLTNQNNLNSIQLAQNEKEINELKIIIKHKENLINTLKSKDVEKEKVFFNNSGSSLKLENSELISENITKLITDNEENRMKIEYLKDKIKTIDEIEKKYSELVKGKKNTVIIPDKIHVNVNKELDQRTPRERKYNNKNHKFYTSVNIKEELKNNIKVNKKDKDNDKKKTHLASSSLPSSNSSNIVNINGVKVRKNMVIKEIKYFKDKNKSEIEGENESKSVRTNNNKNKSVIVLKKAVKQNVEELGMKPSEGVNKNNISFRGRSYYKKGLAKQKTFDEIENKILNEKELEDTKDEIEESLREMENKQFFTQRKKNLNYSEDQVAFEHKDKNKKENNISNYLYGIDRNDFLHTFDISNKIWLEKIKILDLDLDGESDSFRTDYQYEGTILYNTLEGLFILTGENTDTLYYYDSLNNSIYKICKFNNSHNNGSLMYDEDDKILYVFGGKNINSCEYYSFYDKKIFDLPDLITDRANASFIISNNKIFGFFGFSYGKDSYANTIEYINFKKKDKWIELDNIKFLKNDIMFDIESASTMYYKQNMNRILIYSGIQGEDEDFVTEYYLIYDVKKNTMDKINKWDMNQYKYINQKWKDYEIKDNDPKGFHFAKNSRFMTLPESCVPEGYSGDDIIDILIDYKNNVHFVLQDNQKIDVYRGSM